MNMYSEFVNVNRKATLFRTDHNLMTQWIVEMYIDGKVIQKVTMTDQVKARSLAENFIQNDGQAVQTLLSEFL
jgi:hypothetical protein